MSVEVEALRPWTIARVAAALELHPFEVVRILGARGALPVDLRLTPAAMARVVEAGGLEVWWEAEEEPLGGLPALIRRLATELLERGVVTPDWTRADNLFRGLHPVDQAVVRREVNAWIRRGILVSRMSDRGLLVAVAEAAVDHVRAVAEGRAVAGTASLEDG